MKKNLGYFINNNTNMSATIQVTDNANKAWFEAAEKGDLNEMEKVKELTDINIDCVNFNFRSALQVAAFHGHIEVATLLVENGADIHAGNDYALRVAAENGHIEVVKYLVKKGADIHAHNDFALIWTALNGHIEVVTFLVENGADIHAENNLALLFAASNGYIEVVKYLVKNETDIHANNDGALRLAAHHGHIEVVKYLVEKGANIHADNDYALRWAADYGHIGVVEYLKEIKKTQQQKVEEKKPVSLPDGIDFAVTATATIENESVITGEITFLKDMKLKVQVIDGKIILGSLMQ